MEVLQFGKYRIFCQLKVDTSHKGNDDDKSQHSITNISLGQLSKKQFP